MNNKELYIGTATPKSNEVVWIRPLKNGGVALYAYVYNKWQVLKLVNGKGTLPVDDDEVIDPATPGGNYYTKGEIDEKIADILGIDADQIDELIEIVTDDDTVTGLLTEVKNKYTKVSGIEITTEPNVEVGGTDPSFQINSTNFDESTKMDGTKVAFTSGTGQNKVSGHLSIDSKNGKLLAVSQGKSTLTDDCSIITASDISSIKTSQLNNDAGFVGASALTTKQDVLTVPYVSDISHGISAVKNAYYNLANRFLLTSVMIELPRDAKVNTDVVVFLFSTGTPTPPNTLNISFYCNGYNAITYPSGFEFEPACTYEIEFRRTGTYEWSPVKIHNLTKSPEGTQADWNEIDTTSAAYINNKPTIPTKTSEITDDVKVYLSISSWVNVQGESVYTSSDYAADWLNKLYISSDSMDNYNTSVSIDSDNRLKAITQTYYSNYNRIKGYAPYAGTLVIDVRSDSQNSFSTHKWYIKNRSNNVDGAKQYSVNIGVGSSQKYIFYVEKGGFSIMTDAVLSPSSTIVFNSISLIPTLAGLEREASQYSPGYMSAADKTKLDGVATGATANIGTVTGVKINNTTKTPTSGTVDLGTVITGVKLGNTTLTPSSGVVTITPTSDVIQNSGTPITSGGVYTALQNYETKLSFTTSSRTSYNASRNTYYRHINVPSILSITLPSSSLVAGDTCAFNFTTSSSLSSFSITCEDAPIKKMKDFAIEANKTYEVVALYNGSRWLVTATEFE